MAKMKVSDLAKGLNITSKELISFLNMNGFEDVKSPNKFVEDDAIGLIMKSFASKMQSAGTQAKPAQGKTPKPTAQQKKKQSAASKDDSSKDTIVKDAAVKEVTLREKKALPSAEGTAKAETVKTPDKKPVQAEKSKEAPTETKPEKAAAQASAETVVVQPAAAKPAVPQEKSPAAAAQAEKLPQEKASIQKPTPDKKQETAGTKKKEEAKTVTTEQKTDLKTTENSVGVKSQEKKNNGENKNRDNRNNDNRGNDRRDSKNGEGKNNNRGGDRNNNRRDNKNGDNKNADNKSGDGRNSARGNDHRDNRGGGRRDNRNSDSRTNSRGNDRNRDNRNSDSRGNGRGGRNFGGGMGSFAASPIPTKEGSNRGNGYNNKRKNNQRDDDERELRGKKKDPNRKGAFQMPKPVAKPKEAEDAIKTISIPEKLTLKELADKMKQQPAVIIKKLFLQGKMVSINQELTFDEAEEIALEYNCIAELEEKVDVVAELLKEDEEDPATLKKRPPVVCVMGHVDHGKTSLLDAIRQTNVTSGEAGGITQHIGAYMVEVDGQRITFLDTPGHEAFTSMRMRGANSTDIAILVVAADDGVMPQTIEAINHAKAAGIEIIVAVNKIDKPSANIERVKQELVEHELIAEDWGGSTTFVPVSAHTKEGIKELLEMILLTADVCELKANPNRKARGIVIEARLDKGRGPVATILVQKGTLRAGDTIVIGSAYGRIRAMTNDRGQRIKEALPSTPVEIIGLNEVPAAGEIFMVTENEKEARNIASAYINQSKERLIDDTHTRAKLSLDGLFSQIQAGNIKELNLIIKADVQGSVEAVRQSMLKLSNEEVAIRVIHGGVGNINESDVSLASASNAIIIGFNVKPDSTAKDIADREKVDLRLYKVIYNAIEDVEAAMKGMLDPIYEEKVIGHAEIRQTFKASGVGLIAGSYVLDGKIQRGSKARITREGELLFDGMIASLKRFKDDVKEVAAGYECGLVFEGFHDLKEEDQIEIYIMQEVPR